MKALDLLPPSDTMYRALVNRDSSFEGIFFVGVRTTGIFAGRLARPKNRRARMSIFSRRRVKRCMAVIVPVCVANRWIRTSVRRN